MRNIQLRTNPTTSLISWSLLCTAFHSLGDTWPQQVTPGLPDPFTSHHHDQTISLSTQRNVWRGAEVSKCKWTTEFRFPALIEQLLLWGTGEKHNPQAQRILTKPHLLCKVVCRKQRNISQYSFISNLSQDQAVGGWKPPQIVQQQLRCFCLTVKTKTQTELI